MTFLNRSSLLRVMLIALLFLTSFDAVSQQDKEQRKVDSLTNLFKKSTHDTLRVRYMNEVCRVLVVQSKYTKALDFANKAYRLSKNINYSSGMATSKANIGAVQREMGDLDRSFISLNEALILCKKSGDRREEGFVLDQLGHAYWAMKDTTQAINYHKQSLAVRIEAKDYLRAAYSNDNLGFIYAKLSNDKVALNYYKSSLSIYQKMKIDERIALSAGNVGMLEFWLGNKSEALKHYFLAAKKYEVGNNTDGVVWMYGLITNVYLNLKEFDNANIYNRKTLSLQKKLKNEIGIANAYVQIAATYIHKRDFVNGEKALEKSKTIFVKKCDTLGLMNVNLHAGSIYFFKGDYENAMDELNLALKLSEKFKNTRINAHAKRFIGAIYTNKGEAVEAKKWLNEALTFYQETQSTNYLQTVYKLLTSNDSLLGDYKSAFEHYKLYIDNEYKDIKTSGEMHKIAMRYEYEKKEVLAKLALEKKNFYFNLALVGIGIMLLFINVIFILLRLRNKKMEVEQQNVALQKREIEIFKETEHFKNRFLTNISHEFRTPLTLIQGNLELLKATEQVENLGRIEAMERSGERLLLLINELLDLAKMESGDFKLQFVQANVIGEIDVIVQSFRVHAELQNIDFNVSYAATIDQQLSKMNFVHSSEALTTILNNLLSNAFKFTPTGGEINLSVSIEKDQLVLAVMDNGIGIAAKHHTKIFDRFYQVDDESQRSYSGSGIGLALVKELAELHGGNVILENRIEGGSKFIVWLKNGQEQFYTTSISSEIASKTQVVDDRIKEESDTNSQLPIILIVEDEAEIRNLILDRLREEYLCYEAENGKVGFEMALKLIPDLIISDVMMPEIDGMELCTLIKEHAVTSHIPLVLLTAKADHEAKLKGLETGADDYITKPFSIIELQLRVRNMLQMRAVLRQKLKGTKVATITQTPELGRRDREFIEKLNEVVVANIANATFGVNELADEVSISRSQLGRKMKAILGDSPADFIRTIRINKAIELLQQNESVSDVAWSVGFEDAVYFSKVFKKQVGYSPSEIKKDASLLNE